MTKISYANMKLKTKTDTSTVKSGDVELEILQYLPINDKYDLIMMTLQAAYENGIYNALKLDTFFHLYLVYMYSNINFTEKQKEDETKLYDALKSNGIIDTVVSTIPEDEYNDLLNFMEQIIADEMMYRTSASALLQSVIHDLPKQAEAAMKIVDNFDKEKFQNVVDFAKAANGGRDIK